MKAKLMLLGMAATVALTGCASVPQAPKDEAELIAMGEDNLLHVPVDLTGFTWEKLDIVATNGDTGRITVFTDPKTGKTYDYEGQPINEHGARVLTDGYVCEVIEISKRWNQRLYGGMSLMFGYAGADKHYKFCLPTQVRKLNDQRGNRIMLGAALLGGGAALTGVAAGVVAAAGAGSSLSGLGHTESQDVVVDPMSIEEIIAGDTL